MNDNESGLFTVSNSFADAYVKAYIWPETDCAKIDMSHFIQDSENQFTCKLARLRLEAK